MYICELFESSATYRTVVVIPGGFHPFHPGHMSLYIEAKRRFPQADIYFAASDSTAERPFSFKEKQQLAEIAGIDSSKFIQTASPFRPKEITEKYDPNSTVLIFVRSEKDKKEEPIPGGKKKDGNPSYFQKFKHDPLPLASHAYFMYLPVVKFAEAETSASEIRTRWASSDSHEKDEIVHNLYPVTRDNDDLHRKAKEIINSALESVVAESLVDLKSNEILKIARARFPLAQSDEEALYLYSQEENEKEFEKVHKVDDQQDDDIDEIEQVNDRQDRLINRVANIEKELADRVGHLQGQISKLKTHKELDINEAAGVGVVANKKQRNDPRYSMSMTVDVGPDTPQKNISAFFPGTSYKKLTKTRKSK